MAMRTLFTVALLAVVATAAAKKAKSKDASTSRGPINDWVHADQLAAEQALLDFLHSHGELIEKDAPKRQGDDALAAAAAAMRATDGDAADTDAADADALAAARADWAAALRCGDMSTRGWLIVAAVRRGFFAVAQRIMEACMAQGVKVDHIVHKAASEMRKRVSALTNYLQKQRMARLRDAAAGGGGKATKWIEPAFEWAQNRRDVFLQVKFAHKLDAPAAVDARAENVTIGARKISLVAVSNKLHKRYRLKLKLLRAVDPAASTWSHTSAGRARLTLRKAEEDRTWPRLLKAKGKKKSKNMHTWWTLHEKYEQENEDMIAKEEKAKKEAKRAARAAAAFCGTCHAKGLDFCSQRVPPPPADSEGDAAKATDAVQEMKNKYKCVVGPEDEDVADDADKPSVACETPQHVWTRARGCPDAKQAPYALAWTPPKPAKEEEGGAEAGEEGAAAAEPKTAPAAADAGGDKAAAAAADPAAAAAADAAAPDAGVPKEVLLARELAERAEEQRFLERRDAIFADARARAAAVDAEWRAAREAADTRAREARRKLDADAERRRRAVSEDAAAAVARARAEWQAAKKNRDEL